MKRPKWIDPHVLLLLHAETLSEHGGLFGLRDENAFHAALSRPQNIFSYKSNPGIPELAAAYGFGIARSHPFTDGNKRVAFLSIGLFLSFNGYELNVGETEAVKVIVNLAAGKMKEQELTEWIRTNMRKILLGSKFE